MTRPTPDTPPLPRRTRTPSSLKWLLNELYALRGAVTRHTGSLETLEVEERLLLQRLDSVRSRLGSARALRDADAIKLGALTKTIRTLHPDAQIDEHYVINAFDKPYGRRKGLLTQFVIKVCMEAGSEGISTSKVTDLAAAEFGLTFFNGKERKTFFNQIRRRLRGQRDNNGIVESFKAKGKFKEETLWRAVRTLSLEELERLSEAEGE